MQLNRWGNWDAVRGNVWQALKFLGKEKLVDYSFLISRFEADVTKHSGCNATLSIAASADHCLVAPWCESGDSTCTIICIAVVDYLMEFGVARQFESLIKGGKWREYWIKNWNFV